MTKQLSSILTLAISMAATATMGFADPRYPNDLASIRDTEIVNTLRGMPDEHLRIMCVAFPSECRALTALRGIADGKADAELPDCILAYERKIETLMDVFEACGAHKELPKPIESTETKWAKFIAEQRQAIWKEQTP